MTGPDLRETAANIRTHLLGLLRMFASPDEQRNYQRAVPFVPVPTELLCGWADDLYHPDTAAHALAFSPAELAALAGFDAEFGRWSDEVPASDVEAFIASAAGVALARAAAVALEAFAVAPDAEPFYGLLLSRGRTVSAAE
jgi:hypothetical protein